MKRLSFPVMPTRILTRNITFLIALVIIGSILMAPTIESALSTTTKAYAATPHFFSLQFVVAGPTLSAGTNVQFIGSVQESSNNRLQFSSAVGELSNPAQVLKNVNIVQSGTRSITITADYTDNDGDFAHFKIIKLYFKDNLPDLESSSTTFPVKLDIATTPASSAKATEEVADCDTDDPCPPSVAGQETALLNLIATGSVSPALQIN